MSELILGPAHHAALFGHLAREVLHYAGARAQAQRIAAHDPGGATGGEPGAGTEGGGDGIAAGELLREAVMRYGQQRGRRMAQRALADGRPLTWRTYLAYGEWRAAPCSSQNQVIATGDDLHQVALVCPWHAAWRERDLLPYGRHYCLWIDVAIAQGFNPELALDVPGTLSNGAPRCDFLYREANLNDADLDEIAAERMALAPRTVMPWDYHLGHLYKTMGEVIVAELGPAGQQLATDALAAWGAEFGPEAVAAVTRHLETDFDRLPEP
jgi:hypothetical protein